MNRTRSDSQSPATRNDEMVRRFRDALADAATTLWNRFNQEGEAPGTLSHVLVVALLTEAAGWVAGRLYQGRQDEAVTRFQTHLTHAMAEFMEQASERLALADGVSRPPVSTDVAWLSGRCDGWRLTDATRERGGDVAEL